MKRLFLLITVVLLAFNSFAQQDQKYSENDIKQFYRTIQGDYTAEINDTLKVILHFTPIWERPDNPFHWMYLEAVNTENKKVIEQNILEIIAVSDISFRVYVYEIDSPERFAGKWGNRNFFDGFNEKILKGRASYSFLKTKDYEYQTSWYSPKALRCFPKGDQVHFKFVQEDERFYVKRLLARTTNLVGITFFKEPTD